MPFTDLELKKSERITIPRVKKEIFDDKNPELKIFLILILFLIILTIPSAKAITTPGFDSIQVNLAYLLDDDDILKKQAGHFYSLESSKIDSYKNRIEEKWDYGSNDSDQVGSASRYSPLEIGAAEIYRTVIPSPGKNRYNGWINCDKFYHFLSRSNINFLSYPGGYV